MRLRSPYLGEVEVREERILTLPAGLVGFGGLKRFILADYEPGSPFKWLQSVDEPAIAFLAIEPRAFLPAYGVELTPELCALLGVEGEGELALLALVTIPEDPRGMTANLQGPLAINARKKVGAQLVLEGTPYGTRHKILEGFGAPGAS